MARHPGARCLGTRCLDACTWVLVASVQGLECQVRGPSPRRTLPWCSLHGCLYLGARRQRPEFGVPNLWAVAQVHIALVLVAWVFVPGCSLLVSRV